MSFEELYMSKNPLITGSTGQDPAARVFGVPFDSTHSYKPGTRFGPDAIRDAFNNIEVFHEDLGVDLEEAAVEDLGNIRHTVSSEVMLGMVQKVSSELAAKGAPAIMLGGEHLITLGALRALPKDAGYVVFDAHYDLRDQYADARLSHASYLRRAVEERGAGSMLHIGARAYAKEEAAFLRECKMQTITDSDVRSGQGPKMLGEFAGRFGSIYASFDLDVVDPAFAPGVGNPEPAGVASRELFDMVRALSGCRLAGADIVELNPAYDTGAAASLAAKVLSYLVAFAVAGQK